jgi:hypothetical protein
MHAFDKRRAAIAAALSLVAIAAIAAFESACSQVAGIDVTYADSGSASADGGTGGGEGGQLAAPDASIQIPTFTDASFAADDAHTPIWPTCLPDDGGTPCDGTQGLGCCITPTGSSCIDTASIATQCQNGIFVGCQETDPTTESFCCWNHGMSAGASSLFSATCGDRPIACTDSSQCPGGGTCMTTTCGLLVIGACGAAPVCPK